MKPTAKTIEIDATGKVLGRLASEVAIMLRGKYEPTFERHILSNVAVTITNASKVKFTGTKMTGKIHSKYSGYPGGLSHLSLEQLIAKKGYAEPLRLAIYGMLPSNRLRSRMMTKLTITE
jgi:large subunit ribosomal protein L13